LGLVKLFYFRQIGAHKLYFLFTIIYRQLLQDQGYDLFATVRQCGGPHTLTIPHKKLYKVQPLTEDTIVNPPAAAAAAVPPQTTHK
jgi:hypothetical protein